MMITWSSLLKILTNKFDIKDLSVADVILGTNICKTSNQLVLSQSHYIDTIFDKFSKCYDSTIKTPIDINMHLSKNRGKRINLLEYFQIIRSLMYIINCTSPNIAYLVK
jgi:hypothetical protein